MNAVVFHGQKQGPERRCRCDGVVMIVMKILVQSLITVVFRQDLLRDHVVDIFPKLPDLSNGRPELIIERQVVPAHFVDARLKESFVVGVNGVCKQARLS